MDSTPQIKSEEITKTEIYRKDTFRLASIKGDLNAQGMGLVRKPDVINYLINLHYDLQLKNKSND